MHLSGGHLPKHPADLQMNHSCLATALEIPFSHAAEANLRRAACHKTFTCIQRRKRCTKKSLSISTDRTGAIVEKLPNTILYTPKSLLREKTLLLRMRATHLHLGPRARKARSFLNSSAICHSSKASHFPPQALARPMPIAHAINFIHKRATNIQVEAT